MLTKKINLKMQFFILFTQEIQKSFYSEMIENPSSYITLCDCLHGDLRKSKCFYKNRMCNTE